jgi:CAAX protease family protein
MLPASQPELVCSSDSPRRNGLGVATVVGFLLAIVPPVVAPEVLFLKGGDALVRFVSVSRFSATAALLLFYYLLDAALLVLVVRRGERKEWNSIGIRKANYADALSMTATCAIAFALTSLKSHYFPGRARAHGYRKTLLILPRTLRFAAIALDSMVEELGSRAYVFERLLGLTGKVWIAGLLCVATAFAMHAAVWGIGGAVERTPDLLLLVGLYVWRRNLGISVLAHFLIDAELSLVLMLPKSLMPRALFVLGLGHK